MLCSERKQNYVKWSIKTTKGRNQVGEINREKQQGQQIENNNNSTVSFNI